MISYIVVADKTFKVLIDTTVWYTAVRAANLYRSAGGSVTIYKSTKG